MFEQDKSPIAKREEEILALWSSKDIFKKTLKKPAPKGEFIFYEGPPTANNYPAIHHLEARAFKDLLPRYKTMRGYHVRRKAGWDTHGLPVEIEVEKELGLKSKKDIEEYGIEKFNQKCKESVLRYIDEWKEFTDRIGFWVDHESTYFTFDNNYIESVWNALKRVHERGLLYKDYRVVPWCTRCGTPLSSHEIAQEYKEVSDPSVYVLFKLKGRDEHVLVWTTTPWTLPGNAALAVGPDIIHARSTIYGRAVWMAKARLEALYPEAKIEEEKKGADIAGWEYEPLLPYMVAAVPEGGKEKFGNAFKIYTADFVGAEDGTGVVHIAPMYGADDFELGTKHNLPTFHLVNEEGKFIEAVAPFAGMFVKKADKEIIAALGEKIVRTETVTHSYPHCWRCKSPLIYYARDSWYIRMSQLRDELIKENQKIHWEPEHIKDGRFGEWLKEVKDWAISRNRYWGTPLPIWRSQSGKTLVVGSLQELKEKTKRSGNTYLVMRHGEAETNVRNILSSDPNGTYGLTERGKAQVKEAAEKLTGTTIDYIYTSPLLRSRESAGIVAGHLGVREERVIVDVRLAEIGLGTWEGKDRGGYDTVYPNTPEQFERKPDGGECWMDVKRRAGAFLHEVDKKHQNKNILIVSHGDTTWLMQAAARGANREETLEMLGELKNAEVRQVDFAPLPVNGDYELDAHRPYIDAVALEHEGETYERVPEVLDVWFDSGAMPFAQDHYPFENREWIEGVGYPADFISEAIDQTRGWFYTLHAVGILMGRGAAYKNVICLGHLLDKKGKKMSKSLGNVIDPWDMLGKFGADALRYWMYTATDPGASKNFDEKLVDEIVKKHINRLLNVLSFYELFKGAAAHKPERKSKHILDRWIIARLNALIRAVTDNLDIYKIDKAARPLADFIDDLSTWYVRRSRERIKGDDEKDKKAALGTLRHILCEFSKVMAPFMPFVSEHVYRTVSKKEESVHLEDWPEVKGFADDDERELIVEMIDARSIVSLALEKRAAAGIKIRQPLSVLKIAKGRTKSEEIFRIIADEVNVEKVVVDENMAGALELDTTRTPELKKKGEMRDLLRAVQELRKKKGLKHGEKAALLVGTSVVGRTRVEEMKKTLMKTASIGSIEYDSVETKPLVFDEYEVRLALK